MKNQLLISSFYPLAVKLKKSHPQETCEWDTNAMYGVPWAYPTVCTTIIQKSAEILLRIT